METMTMTHRADEWDAENVPVPDLNTSRASNASKAAASGQAESSTTTDSDAPLVKRPRRAPRRDPFALPARPARAANQSRQTEADVVDLEDIDEADPSTYCTNTANMLRKIAHGFDRLATQTPANQRRALRWMGFLSADT